MGILRRLASWRTGFALVFMCMATAGFLENALSPELEVTETQRQKMSNSTFVFKPSKSSKSSKSTRGAIARSNNTGNTIDNEKVNAFSPSTLTIEDVRSMLTEMAQKKLGTAFQGIQFDDNTLQWMAGSGKVDSILLNLSDISPEHWGSTLSGLKAKDLEGRPEHLVGRPRDDSNDCPFGICSNT